MLTKGHFFVEKGKHIGFDLSPLQLKLDWSVACVWFNGCL